MRAAGCKDDSDCKSDDKVCNGLSRCEASLLGFPKGVTGRCLEPVPRDCPPDSPICIEPAAGGSLHTCGAFSIHF